MTEFVTNLNEGCEKPYYDHDRGDEYFIEGCIVKNSCFYSITLTSDWADKAEADRIFSEWAENF